MSDVTLARFVGGEVDGRTYAFPGVPPFWWKVATTTPLPLGWLWRQDPTGMEPVTDETKIYHRHMFEGNRDNFYVFAPQDWTRDEVLGHLLFGKDVIVSDHD